MCYKSLPWKAYNVERDFSITPIFLKSLHHKNRKTCSVTQVKPEKFLVACNIPTLSFKMRNIFSIIQQNSISFILMDLLKPGFKIGNSHVLCSISNIDKPGPTQKQCVSFTFFLDIYHPISILC